MISSTQDLATMADNEWHDMDPPLCGLPAEIHLKIFDLLHDDPEASACLGLTCKKFYPLFAARHLKTKLVRNCEDCGKLLEGPKTVHPTLALINTSTAALVAKITLLQNAGLAAQGLPALVPTSDICNAEGHQKGWKALFQLLKQWRPSSMVFVFHVNKFVDVLAALKIQEKLQAKQMIALDEQGTRIKAVYKHLKHREDIRIAFLS